MAIWPTDLPKPLLSDYAVDPEQAFIRTQMESGPARQRKRFTQVPHRVNVSWRFTHAQMATFRTFFGTTINLGTDWFTCNLDAGSGLADYDTRFTIAPKYAAVSGMNWEVTAVLELRNA